jgi:hypothetical protein
MGSSYHRRRLAVVAALGAVLAVTAYGLGPGSAGASSHREAPRIMLDPAADNTDLYAFASPDRPGYVTFIANWAPFSEPDGGPNFYPFATDAAYYLKVDNDGDAMADAVFRWTVKNIDRRGNSTFLYNNGPVTSLDEPESAVPPGVHARVVVQRSAVPDPRHRPAGGAVARGQRVHAGLPEPAQPGHEDAQRRLAHVRRPGRRPVLPGPAGVRPCSTGAI